MEVNIFPLSINITSTKNSLFAHTLFDGLLPVTLFPSHNASIARLNGVWSYIMYPFLVFCFRYHMRNILFTFCHKNVLGSETSWHMSNSLRELCAVIHSMQSASTRKKTDIHILWGKHCSHISANDIFRGNLFLQGTNSSCLDGAKMLPAAAWYKVSCV